MEIRHFGIWIAFLVGAAAAGADRACAEPVIREEGRIFIQDRMGERWDVTRAETLGFHPEGFQFGIGRDAFIPLTDARVRKEGKGIPGRLRVIGVVQGEEKRAYSVPRLGGHEVANSTLGGNDIAVAY